MDRSTVLFLINETFTQDEIGQQIPIQTSTEVFAQVESVSGTEWHNAGRNDIRPAYKFTMFVYDYNNEKIVIYDGIRYEVYRTYIKKNDYIELYVQEKAMSDNG